MVSELADAPPPYGTVVFDCDSTLCSIEGIEELARDAGPALAEMTQAAMEGRVALEEVYGRRLALVRPSRADVERVGTLYVERLLPHAAQLVRALAWLGKRVAIVSGGVLPAVRAVAAHLGVAPELTRAVDLRWGADGSYLGFDESSPLARAGGKCEVLEELARRPQAGALAFVGDGATDLEAAHLAARFIAFGGVERRPAVFSAARVRYDRPDFAGLLPLVTSPDERARLASDPEHAALVRAARPLT